jgi:hypothetical protein
MVHCVRVCFINVEICQLIATRAKPSFSSQLAVANLQVTVEESGGLSARMDHQTRRDKKDRFQTWRTRYTKQVLFNNYVQLVL